MLGSSPGLGPSSGIEKTLIASCALMPPCSWEEGEDAPKPRPHDRSVSLEFPNGGVPGHRCAIQLQPGVLNWMVHVGCVLSLPTVHRKGPPFVLSHLLLFGLLLEDQLPLFIGLILFPFLL